MDELITPDLKRFHFVWHSLQADQIKIKGKKCPILNIQMKSIKLNKKQS